MGHPSMYLEENDTGPDDAVHDWRGVGIIYHPDVDMSKKIDRDFIPIQDLYGIYTELLGIGD